MFSNLEILGFPPGYLEDACKSSLYCRSQTPTLNVFLDRIGFRSRSSNGLQTTLKEMGRRFQEHGVLESKDAGGRPVPATCRFLQ